MNGEFARIARIEALHEAAAERILVLDGSWGAKIQELRLTEEDFRGDRFADHSHPLRGDMDMLCLTRPAVITELLYAYLGAGADIASTNTFTATTIAQSDYGMQEIVSELNVAAARLAREAADRFTAVDPSRPRWVAGSIGPTNRTLSMSADVNDPGARAVDFDQVYDAYRQQAIALYDGGVDLFLVETVFDTLNAKAALKAILDLEDEGRTPLPIWISGTIADLSGRTLSGQTVDAFWIVCPPRRAVRRRAQLRASAPSRCGRSWRSSPWPPTRSSRRIRTQGCRTSSASTMRARTSSAVSLREWAQAGLVNVVGGCCGTTPAAHPCDRRRGRRTCRRARCRS